MTSPLRIERKSNTVDEYSILVANYGYPSSILATERLGVVPTRVARYATVGLKVVFVPNPCAEAYAQAVRTLSERSRYPALAGGQTNDTMPCVTSPNNGWTIVSYLDSYDDDGTISTEVAKSRLDKITLKQTTAPLVETERPAVPRRKRAQRRPLKKQPHTEPEERPKQRWTVPDQISQHAKAADWMAIYSRSLLLLVALAQLVFGAVLHRRNTEKRTTRLFYELGKAELQRFGTIRRALEHLGNCDRVWRIEARAATSDWKRNARASTLVRRIPITIVSSNPPHVETNLDIPCLNLGDARLFFFPDVILYLDHGTYGGIAYGDIRVEQCLTRFIEDEEVPADATVIDRTWRFVNKSGGPDRRFANNAQLPVVQYGALFLTSTRGLNIHLNTSSGQESLTFANYWHSLKRETGKADGRQTSAPKTPGAPSVPDDQALKVLGLNPQAPLEEISAAYHRLAQLYHPDKVASLAPEFQILADTRMKELNAAYAALKRTVQTGMPVEEPLHQSPINLQGEAEIRKIFAGESETARTLALEHGRFWEYLLTEELVRSRLSVVQEQYARLDEIASRCPRIDFTGADYMRWLLVKFESFTSMVQRIRQFVEVELPGAWGKPGAPGDAAQILRVAQKITETCLSLYTWELEFSVADPPVGLRQLGRTLRGISSGIFTELGNLPDELGRAVSAARLGAREFDIRLNFKSPHQVAAFLQEMENVKSHPEWPA